jgi:hypothetical protein
MLNKVFSINQNVGIEPALNERLHGFSLPIKRMPEADIGATIAYLVKYPIVISLRFPVPTTKSQRPLALKRLLIGRNMNAHARIYLST